MCFSATASFTAAAVLLPAGAYCLKVSNQIDKRYWAFAILPFMFGLQQLIEGGVWLALQQDDADMAHSLALAFLLFSHVFWLGWVAYSASLVESSVRLATLFVRMVVFGVLFGAMMYVPLLLRPEWMVVSIVNHSIHYELVFISDAYISQTVITALYAIVILLPLLLSSDRYHKRLGLLVLISGLVTWSFYEWVFISVWCYFAALISVYIFVAIARSVQATKTTDVAL